MNKASLEEYYNRTTVRHSSHDEQPILEHYQRRMEALSAVPGYTWHIEGDTLVQEKMSSE